MNKLQKVLNEVERLQNELIKEKKKGNGSDVDDACILELQNIKNYIKFVQEEPVSEELNEAALMHFKDVMEYEVISGHEMPNMTSFKAGANWQKEQIMKDAVEATCLMLPYPDLFKVLYCYDIIDKLKHNDKIKLIPIKED